MDTDTYLILLLAWMLMEEQWSLEPALGCTHGNTAGCGATEQIIHNRDTDENLVMNDDLALYSVCACISALNQIELDIGDGGGEVRLVASSVPAQ